MITGGIFEGIYVFLVLLTLAFCFAYADYITSKKDK